MARKSRIDVESGTLALALRGLVAQVQDAEVHLNQIKSQDGLLIICGVTTSAVSSFMTAYSEMLSRLGLEDEEIALLMPRVPTPEPPTDSGAATATQTNGASTHERAI